MAQLPGRRHRRAEADPSSSSGTASATTTSTWPPDHEHGIVFANEATASSEDVAEHALMLMLEAYKKKRVQDEMLKDWIRTGRWSSEKIHPLFRLAGKTIGIVGCGNIGSRVFQEDPRAAASKSSSATPTSPSAGWTSSGIPNTPLDKLLKESDIVTIHVPVTAETRGLFDVAKFALMKTTAVLVNTARGPMIKTADLIEALKAGPIAGAALDVFEEEPPKPKLALFKMDNVILSPHIAWYSEEGGLDIRRHDHGRRPSLPRRQTSPARCQPRGAVGPEPQAQAESLAASPSENLYLPLRRTARPTR